MGVEGCSRTVCGTSTISTRPAAIGKVCATAGAKPGIIGEAGVEADCCSWRCMAKSLSIGVELAMPVPGFLMGNSSSSTGLGIGMGPEILPRMVWWPVLGLAVVGEDGGPPNSFAFILPWSTEVVGLCLGGPDRRNWRGGEGEEEWSAAVVVVVVVVLEVNDDSSGPGPDDPSGIAIDLKRIRECGEGTNGREWALPDPSQPCGDPLHIAINAKAKPVIAPDNSIMHYVWGGG